MERAELGIDGNCGFALLGESLQEGEAEFVEIASPGDTSAQLTACKKALRALQARLGRTDFSYYFGRSHPYGD